jgi:hypothetical protein
MATGAVGYAQPSGAAGASGMALQVPHHLPTPLQLTLVLLLATLLVSLVSLPLLPLSSLSSKQPEYLSSLPPSHENTRL